MVSPAGRLRGVVTHLSLARAGRSSASAVLPLLALLTALTTASFGGSVLAGIGEARDHSALLAVGADARLDATVDSLPTGLTDRVRRVSGVRDVAAVSVAYRAKPNDGRQSVPVVGVDPGGYAELTRRTGLGAFSEGVLKKGRGGPGTGAVLPAVASPSVADVHGSAPFPVSMEDGSSVSVRIVLVRDITPAVMGADFLVVDRAGLGATAARPTTLLVTGPEADGRALREAAGDAVSVRLRADERAQYVDSPSSPAWSTSTRRRWRQAPATPCSRCSCHSCAPPPSASRCSPVCAPWASPVGRAAACSSWSPCPRPCSPRRAAS